MNKKLFKLIELPVIGRRVILKTIVKRQEGQQQSDFLRDYVKYKYKVEIGKYTYGSCFSPEFNLGGAVEVGRYGSFASNVRYFGGNHPMEYVSMSPYFYNKSFGYNVKDIPRKKLIIGHDVWCGYGVIITNKCTTIGNGAVIAAGSVVTKDVPPYAIVAGSPAKIIRYRFDDETIAMIEKSKWFNFSPDQLMKYYSLIDNPMEFAKAISDYSEEGE